MLLRIRLLLRWRIFLLSRPKARSTGFKPLDTVLGKGFVPGGAVLVGGEPGIGKSTLLLQLAAEQCRMGNKAVYFSGEESLAQIRGRADRLGSLAVRAAGCGIHECGRGVVYSGGPGKTGP